MREQPRSTPVEALRREQETAETLRKEGGISWREEADSATGEMRRYINILGCEVESYASREDVETLKKELILSDVDQELLLAIAESYKLRQPLMFEGEPGMGKTFLMKKFVQFIHGREAPILEMVGTPRTSDLEILGHWAPKGLTDKEEEEYRELVKEMMEQGEASRLSENTGKKIADLSERREKGEITAEGFSEEFGSITTEYIESSKKTLMDSAQAAKFLKPGAQYEFKKGALLQCYSGREGDGNILIVDEFNLIPSNYQQIFLQIGGERGQMSDSVSFWGNSGKTRYARGKDSWICFASNFPEKTPGRSEVVAPMTDRLVWKTLTAEDAEKKKAAVKKTAGGRLSRRTQEVGQIKSESMHVTATEQLEWDKALDERLGEVVADIVDVLDSTFVKQYEQLGDKVTIKGEERSRTQQMEFSGRNALRLFSYLDHFQTRDPKTGIIDFARTMLSGFRRYYVDRLANGDAREKALLTFIELMEGDTGKIEFEGKNITRKAALEDLVKRAFMKEKAEEKKEENRDIRHASFDLEDQIEKLIKKGGVSDAVRRKLST